PDELALLAGLGALGATLARDLERGRREQADRDVLAVDAGKVRDHEDLVLVLADVHAELAADRGEHPVADTAGPEATGRQVLSRALRHAADPGFHRAHQVVELTPERFKGVLSVCHSHLSRHVAVGPRLPSGKSAIVLK